MLKWLSRIFGRQSGTATEAAQSKEFIEKLILSHQRRLQKLKEQQVLSKQNIDQAPPHVLIEIEDIEAEIQRLESELEDENVKNKDEIKRMIKDYSRRLQILKEQPHANPAILIAIEDLEAETQRLRNELEDENAENKDEVERRIQDNEHRLRKLKETQVGSQQSSDKEIEDIEAEIQRLQSDLENASVQNKDEIRNVIMMHQYRLQALKEVQGRSEQQNHEQEIREIEAEIQQLQAELESLNN
jgi:chromosome segregation ATPase